MKNSTASLAPEEMKIVHAIGGRVRLRCNSDRARELLPTIGQDLRERAGIRKVTTNKTTGSLLVEFDPNNFSPGQLTQLLQPWGIALPSPTKATTSTDSSLSSSQSQTYERLLSLVPPLLGLAIVRGIGVTGWKSLVTYLVATGVIREIWEQLVPAASSQSTSTPAVLEKPKLNAADESENSNPLDGEKRITPRQEDEESSSGQENPLKSHKRHPSKRKPRKADITSRSNSPQKEHGAEPEGIVTSEADETAKLETEEAADSIKEMIMENESYWSNFKSSMLSMMLKLIGKLPVQTA
ncbi:hypothetical protein IQ238_00665 [Pleurocapsales cyanobacterium LEGE 06147]|nr:hypothetical protein [Pleurocapsales cyanobacterium LEGE 06147]